MSLGVFPFSTHKHRESSIPSICSVQRLNIMEIHLGRLHLLHRINFSTETKYQFWLVKGNPYGVSNPSVRTQNIQWKVKSLPYSHYDFGPQPYILENFGFCMILLISGVYKRRAVLICISFMAGIGEAVLWRK